MLSDEQVEDAELFRVAAVVTGAPQSRQAEPRMLAVRGQAGWQNWGRV